MKKVLLIFFIVTTSVIAEIKTVDAFFANIGGRYSYEANFNKNGYIDQLIKINDFKDLKIKDGCFDIDDFDKNGKIFKFLNKKGVKSFCN
mgnify:FL=1